MRTSGGLLMGGRCSLEMITNGLLLPSSCLGIRQCGISLLLRKQSFGFIFICSIYSLFSSIIAGSGHLLEFDLIGLYVPSFLPVPYLLYIMIN